MIWVVLWIACVIGILAFFQGSAKVSGRSKLDYEDEVAEPKNERDETKQV